MAIERSPQTQPCLPAVNTAPPAAPRADCFLWIDRKNWKKPYETSLIAAEKYPRMNFHFRASVERSRSELSVIVEDPAACKGGQSFVAHGCRTAGFSQVGCNIAIR